MSVQPVTPRYCNKKNTRRLDSLNQLIYGFCPIMEIRSILIPWLNYYYERRLYEWLLLLHLTKINVKVAKNV